MLGSEPIFSVSEFVAVFNQTLETAYPKVRIAGELANLRISRGQWVYMDLKDDAAQVKFFGTTRQLPGPLEDGMMLEIVGYPRLHPKYGFSVTIESIKVSGEGSIKKAQDLLASKLKTEGLFDPARKRPLPYAPRTVGLITARDSAACGDFKKIIDARWGNVSVELIDVKVQGSESPDQIVAAVKQFNESAYPPEVLVVVRGGGSPEDLSSFSDERVVRAVASSRIPTLVAIGHELDVSLSELAADMRASTPSNAAEILVPDRQAEKRIIEMWKAKLSDLSTGKVRTELEYIRNCSETVDRLANNYFDLALRDIDHKKLLIALLDPRAPLRRGYALVKNSKGKLFKSINEAKVGDSISISLVDGTIISKVEEKQSGKVL